MASLDLGSKKKTEKQKLAQLAAGHDALRKGKGEEEVFVKATGRAMEKALAVGRWFETREAEYVTRVKTGCVLVVDDVVEDEEMRGRVIAEGEEVGEEEELKEQQQQGQNAEATSAAPVSKSAAKKRKRAANAESEELPESRTRWVNVVEIAVTYK